MSLPTGGKTLINKEILKLFKNLIDASLNETHKRIDEFKQSNDRTFTLLERAIDENSLKEEDTVKCYDHFLTCANRVTEELRKLGIQLYFNNIEQYDPNEIFSGIFKPSKDAVSLNGSSEIKSTNPFKSKMVTKDIREAAPSRSPTVDQTSKQSVPEDGIKVETIGSRNTTTSKEKAEPSFYDRILEEFTFPKKEISKRPNCLIKACVTFIHNLDKIEFFLLETDDPDSNKMINLATEGPLDNDAIDVKEVFGIVQEGDMLRACLSNKQSDKNEMHKIFLIDFGEILQVPKDTPKFRLSKACQEFPAQALPAQWDTDIKKVTQKIITNILNVPANFFVRSVKNGILHVMFVDKVDKASKNEIGKYYFSCDGYTRFSYANSDKPFEAPNGGGAHNAFSEEKKDIILNDSNKNNKNPFVSKKTQKNPKNPKILQSPDTSSSSFPSSSSEKPNTKLTQAEWDMLCEEPLNAKAAIEAVVGYIPKDLQRICEFYDPITGGCFKGSSCRKEHIPMEPDGWTKDTGLNNCLNLNIKQTIKFDMGSTIKVCPTYIPSPDKFYAQILDKDYSDLILYWERSAVPKGRFLKKPPAPFELVLALHNDGFWYRAQVQPHESSSQFFSIYFIDYGDTTLLPLCNLAFFDESTGLIPPQAHLFHINGAIDVCGSPEQTEECISIITEKIVNKNINIKIIKQINDDIFARFSGDLSNFVKSLIKQGYLKYGDTKK